VSGEPPARIDGPLSGFVLLDEPADLAGLTEDELVGFFEGWPEPPSAALHLKILQGSAVAVVAIDPVADRVVGFVTAVSDGGFAAFVPLLEVLPDYRGRGIGSALIRRVLDRLAGHYSVDVVCDESLLPFYERLGLARLVAAGRRDRLAIRAANARRVEAP
jgi:GNAT superfamily N-acetyltransferase